jgi:hypothetical protein
MGSIEVDLCLTDNMSLCVQIPYVLELVGYLCFMFLVKERDASKLQWFKISPQRQVLPTTNAYNALNFELANVSGP